ncbi:DUF1905 domain-containing protein [Ilumatobacter sp.]|uniref:DUF1905 domain-containing protein n=1 Tax=Ilumatobacter sp. TaxID=1967498 RepID=UPI003B520653
MDAGTYRFTGELWEWVSRTSWFFVSLPEETTDLIDERHGGSTAGFGSLPVEVTVGSTTWRTSIFPSKEEATFVLPVKKAVRVAEGIEPGGSVEVEITVLVDDGPSDV